VGDDEIEGGLGNDVIKAGVGDDVLTGGKGDDRLDGGDGFDTYVIDSNEGNDVIIDSDGKGQVMYEGGALTGVATATGGKYVSTDGKLTFSFAGDIDEGGVLTISTEGGRIKITNFHNGMLGIKLGDGSPGALFPPADPAPISANDRLAARLNSFDAQSITYLIDNANTRENLPMEGATTSSESAPLEQSKLASFIAGSDFNAPLITGANFAQASGIWQPAPALVADVHTSGTEIAAAPVGITAADVVSAVMDFHDATVDAQLGGDSLLSQANESGNALLAHGDAASRLAKRISDIDTTHIAPRIGG
jgi:hypothetical protein